MSDSPSVNRGTGLEVSSAGVYLLFNASHQLSVKGEGTPTAPWSISNHPEVSEASPPKYITQCSLDGSEVAIYLSKLPIDATFKEGQWETLKALFDADDERIDAFLRSILNSIEPHLIEIPYLDFGPNEFIYRFRTEKQRNRSVYQSDAISSSLYQSELCKVIKSARTTPSIQSSRRLALLLKIRLYSW